MRSPEVVALLTVVALTSRWSHVTATECKYESTSSNVCQNLRDRDVLELSRLLQKHLSLEYQCHVMVKFLRGDPDGVVYSGYGEAFRKLAEELSDAVLRYNAFLRMRGAVTTWRNVADPSERYWTRKNPALASIRDASRWIEVLQNMTEALFADIRSRDFSMRKFLGAELNWQVEWRKKLGDWLTKTESVNRQPLGNFFINSQLRSKGM